MSTRTFSALVKNGQLSFGESLADLEGQSVVVTLAPSVVGNGSELVPVLPPPDWLGIEQSVVFQMPYHWELVQVEVIEAGDIPPVSILPQVLPDD